MSDLWSHIAEDSSRAADRFTARLVKRFPTLATHPEMGRLREDLAAALRSLEVGNYVIFYRPIDDGVEIVRVLHGARDVESLFAE